MSTQQEWIDKGNPEIISAIDMAYNRIEAALRAIARAKHAPMQTSAQGESLRLTRHHLEAAIERIQDAEDTITYGWEPGHPNDPAFHGDDMEDLEEG